jgi:hypothetical protein
MNLIKTTECDPRQTVGESTMKKIEINNEFESKLNFILGGERGLTFVARLRFPRPPKIYILHKNTLAIATILPSLGVGKKVPDRHPNLHINFQAKFISPKNSSQFLSCA